MQGRRRRPSRPAPPDRARTLLVASPHFVLERITSRRNPAGSSMRQGDLGPGARRRRKVRAGNAFLGEAVFLEADRATIEVGFDGLTGLVAYAARSRFRSAAEPRRGKRWAAAALVVAPPASSRSVAGARGRHDRDPISAEWRSSAIRCRAAAESPPSRPICSRRSRHRVADLETCDRGDDRSRPAPTTIRPSFVFRSTTTDRKITCARPIS